MNDPVVIAAAISAVGAVIATAVGALISKRRSRGENSKPETFVVHVQGPQPEGGAPEPGIPVEERRTSIDDQPRSTEISRRRYDLLPSAPDAGQPQVYAKRPDEGANVRDVAEVNRQGDGSHGAVPQEDVGSPSDGEGEIDLVETPPIEATYIGGDGDDLTAKFIADVRRKPGAGDEFVMRSTDEEGERI